VVEYSATLPAPGETVVGRRFEQGPGGKGANQAIGARRLGTDVLFVTRLGADAFGEQARSVLLAEGLPEGRITTDDQSPTGIALILVDDTGQNAISVAPGANASLSGPDVLARFGPDLGDCTTSNRRPARAMSSASPRTGRCSPSEQAQLTCRDNALQSRYLIYN
jgi:sugar/nucleoside kinase (ribokinase family)